MSIWDDRILEAMRRRDDKIAQVKELAEEETIRISCSSVSRRCQKLAEHLLIKKVGDGVYLLTERGGRYLDGEISTYEDEPDEIPDSDESDEGAAPPSNAGGI